MIEPDLILSAYRNGYFPMADPETKEINWYKPEMRAIFILKDLKLPRSLHQLVKKNNFEITYNQNFKTVIKNCSYRNETWISKEIISSYLKLHKLGFGFSVEAWKNTVIVGGLYGIALGGIFFGESMFSKISGASKVAFASLVEKLKKQNFDIIDAQFMNEHLKILGAIEIPQKEYENILTKSLNKYCRFE
ncbi:MAG: leucyl/phenylalanyl-tRNA--protein transferase [Ignavibacteria bacterium]|nr:leucyl/phenylalanyl-tRNA--protein transferase [Bacteroidota bacterium]MSQ46251.1 leucyl/phenylalanyl-tRNA--protein transferase [Ignavibacteria bacterium]